MSERVYKQIVVHGRRGSAQALAIIDTGTPHSVIPKALAEEVGAVPVGGRTGKLNIAARGVRGRIYEVEIEIPMGGCCASTEVFVPDDPDAKVRVLVGSLYLQEVGAIITYDEDGEAVFCRSGKFEEDSWAADFVEDGKRRGARR